MAIPMMAKVPIPPPPDGGASDGPMYGMFGGVGNGTTGRDAPTIIVTGGVAEEATPGGVGEGITAGGAGSAGWITGGTNVTAGGVGEGTTAGGATGGTTPGGVGKGTTAGGATGGTTPGGVGEGTTAGGATGETIPGGVGEVTIAGVGERTTETKGEADGEGDTTSEIIGVTDSVQG